MEREPTLVLLPSIFSGKNVHQIQFITLGLFSLTPDKCENRIYNEKDVDISSEKEGKSVNTSNESYICELKEGDPQNISDFH